MSPGTISRKVIADRIMWAEQMVQVIQSLPLANFDKFIEDKRSVWAAESCLRRSIEALLDIGRHILAKGFGIGVSEYKEIAEKLKDKGVVSKKDVILIKTIAGYRNRLVHFYSEITEKELYQICTKDVKDLIYMKNLYLKWLKKYPQLIDDKL